MGIRAVLLAMAAVLLSTCSAQTTIVKCDAFVEPSADCNVGAVQVNRGIKVSRIAQQKKNTLVYTIAVALEFSFT